MGTCQLRDTIVRRGVLYEVSRQAFFRLTALLLVAKYGKADYIAVPAWLLVLYA